MIEPHLSLCVPLNSGLHCISTASLWHGFHFFRYKAGVVASQLGLLAATGSVQRQRHRLHWISVTDWIEEIFGYPMIHGAISGSISLVEPV